MQTWMKPQLTRFISPLVITLATLSGVLDCDAQQVGGTQWNAPPIADGPIASGSITDRPVTDPAVRLAQAPSLPVEDPLGLEAQEKAESFLPPGTRQGIFQKANFSTLYVPSFEGDGLGISGLDSSVVFGVPFPRRETPLLITPRHRALFFEGPEFVDVPARVHEAELGLQHFRKISDRWLFNGAVTVGVYGDEDSLGDGDALRVTGRALGIYEFTQCWKAIVGVVYLNRAGYSVVPAAGLTYDRGDFQVDLVFPRPRVAWLLPGSTPTAGNQRWLFLQGELGGNLWAVERTTGVTDQLSYNDLRLLVGYENKVIGGVSQRWEFGYVFARELEYDSENFDRELDDTLFVRAGITY